MFSRSRKSIHQRAAWLKTKKSFWFHKSCQPSLSSPRRPRVIGNLSRACETRLTKETYSRCALSLIAIAK